MSSSGNRSSRVHDITGRVLAQTGVYQQWVSAVLPLGRRLFETDYNAAHLNEIQEKYGSKIDLVWYHDDGWFTLASMDPDLTVADIEKEYRLTPLDEYRARAAKAIQRARR